MSDQFMIKWFRENTTEVVEDLGLGTLLSRLGDNRFLSEYHVKTIFNQPYSPSLLGKYWCQVINTTADPDQPLMKSNVFKLLAPAAGDYSGSTCNSKLLQAVRNVACADLHSEQTTMPAPSSTTSNHNCPIGNLNPVCTNCCVSADC